MKKSLRYTYLTVICLITSVSAFAQKQHVYYLKNTGRFVNQRDSADYIRIISQPDSGSTLYKFNEFYLNGAKKRVGKTSKDEIILLEDSCITYFPTGILRQKAYYRKDSLQGKMYDYYPNGKLYNIKDYTYDINTNNPIVKILTTNDSSGKKLVINGVGHHVSYNEKFSFIEEEGNIKAGSKDGNWIGTDSVEGNKITFTEKYINGKFISGRSIKNGNAAKYTQRQILPQFKGGDTAFIKFLQDNIRYPAYEKQRDITGRVILKFVVDKNGDILNIETYKDPSPGLTAEAIRVLKISPKWVPGSRFGWLTDVQYTLPLNFSLQ